MLVKNLKYIVFFISLVLFSSCKEGPPAPTPEDYQFQSPETVSPPIQKSQSTGYIIVAKGTNDTIYADRIWYEDDNRKTIIEFYRDGCCQSMLLDDCILIKRN